MTILTPSAPLEKKRKQAIYLLAIGSRGDLEPVLATGLRILRTARERGRPCRVVIVTHRNFVPFVQKTHGTVLEVKGLSSDSEKTMCNADTLPLVFSGDLSTVVQIFATAFDGNRFFSELQTLCADASVAIGGVAILIPLLALRATMGIPVGYMLTVPLSRGTLYDPILHILPRESHPDPVVMGERRLALHDGQYRILFEHQYHSQLNAWMDNAGLLPYATIEESLRDYESVPVHGIFSDMAIPRDPLWPASVTQGGFVYPEQSSLPPLAPELDKFLNADPAHPPVYFGFGSMPVASSGRLFPLLADVMAHSPPHRRFVVHIGSMDPAVHQVDETDYQFQGHADLVRERHRIYLVKSVSHLLLFPRCSVILHHCGAGTTGAALWSGRPAVPCPVYYDQSFWAERIVQLGSAVLPVPFHEATGIRLAAAIEEALKPCYVQRAEEVARHIRAEDGCQAAANWVLDLVDSKHAGKRPSASPAAASQMTDTLTDEIAA